MDTYPLFFNIDGQAIDLEAYTLLFRDREYRFLARDTVGDVEVVTAWLGTDQGPDPRAVEPLIFGTVGLLADSELYEGTELFASTKEEALLNHQAHLEHVKATAAAQ